MQLGLSRVHTSSQVKPSQVKSSQVNCQVTAHQYAHVTRDPGHVQPSSQPSSPRLRTVRTSKSGVRQRATSSHLSSSLSPHLGHWLGTHIIWACLAMPLLQLQLHAPWTRSQLLSFGTHEASLDCGRIQTKLVASEAGISPVCCRDRVALLVG